MDDLTTCPHCNIEFKPTYHQRKALAAGRIAYHNRECQIAAAQETRQCATCGKDITKRRSEFRSGPAYCDRVCSGIAKRRTVAVTCGTCGIEFQRIESAATGPVYCSRPCYHEAERAEGGIAKCAACGNDVPVRGVRRRRAAAGDPVYCNHECQKNAARVTVPCAGCGTPVQRYKRARENAATDRVFCGGDDCPGSTLGFKPRRGSYLTCVQCGEKYYRSPGMVKGSRFCTDVCRQEHEAVSRVTKTCEWCSIEFTVIPARADQRYCNAECKRNGQTTNAVPGQWHNGRPKRYDDNGYILIYEPDRPMNYHGWVFEHRYVMEESLGRFLPSTQEVDHINEVKSDNALTNLRVVDKVTHQGITAANAVRRRKADAAELNYLRQRIAELEGGS